MPARHPIASPTAPAERPPEARPRAEVVRPDAQGSAPARTYPRDRAAGPPRDALAAVLARAVAARAAEPLPAGLRAGMERLSGLAMGDVRVTYQSPHPGRLGAAAFARGTQIHLAPGAERELAHEAWHVVQQKRGSPVADAVVAGVPASLDPSLEREADRMGARAEAAARAPLSSDAPPPQDLTPQRPVIQGRWLISSPTEYFWEDDDYDINDAEAPSWLFDHLYYVPAPAPGTYVVSSGQGRVPRGKTLVYTIDEWAKINNLGKATAPRDVYNPFGRFASDSVTSFLPSRELSDTQRDALVAGLESGDRTFSKITGLRPVPPGQKDVPRSPGGYPMEVVVATGAVLRFIEEGPFGAVYAQSPAVVKMATADPKRVQGRNQLTIVTGSEEYKLAQNFKITAQELQTWSGAKRSRTQEQVMGVSAGDAAEHAGFKRDEGKGWEWLHLIAHSMGGLERFGPQVAGNLVAGTSECNTQMIIAEEFIKDQVSKSGGFAAVFVNVRLLDPLRHIGDQIGYDVELHNGDNEPVAVYHWSFNALSRSQPLALFNRSTRYAGRQLHPDGGEQATTHMPRTQPTAHGPLATGDYDAAIERAVEVFKTCSAVEFLRHLKTILTKRGTPPTEVLDDVGELLRPDQVTEYLTLLGAAFGVRPMARVVRSFVIDHPHLKGWMLDEVLTPLLAPMAVPNELRDLCV